MPYFNDNLCFSLTFCLPKMIFTHSVFLILALLVATGFHPLYAANQTTAVKAITQAELEQKIHALNDKHNLPPELKNRILGIYNESQDNLKETQSQDNQGEAYKQAMNSLPIAAKQLARQIADAENRLKNRKPEKLGIFPTDEVEQRLIIEKTALSDLDAEISRLESQASEELNRPQLIREKIAEIKTKQSAAQQEQQSFSNRNIDNIAENEAKQLRLETRIKLLNSTLKTLELENISEPIRLQNSKDRMRLLNVQREQLSMVIADLDNFLLDRRQQEIDKEQAELLQAEKAAEGKHPLIQAATKENIQYNRSLQEINKNMEQFNTQKNELDIRYKELDKDFQSAAQKINLAGLSPALGNLLREQRRNLPQRKQYTDLNDKIQNEIAQTSLETFKLDDAKKNLNDVGQAMQSRMAQQLPTDMSEADKLRLRTELRMLLNDQKDLVLRLSSVYTEYGHVLGDVDFSLQQLLTVADKFSAFLDERLLWVPSAPVIDRYYLQDILKSLLWFATPTNWQQVAVNFEQGIANYPALVLLGLLLIALHWYFKTKIKQCLQTILPQNPVGSIHQSFNNTLLSLAYLIVLSISGSLLMLWVSGVLILSHSSEYFSRAFAVGLFSASISLGILQFFYRLFQPKGIAETQFQWQKINTQLLYSQFKWLRFVLVPTVFMTAMTGSDVFSEHSYALGRTALIIMMLAMTYAYHRLTHPVSGLGKSFYQTSNSWIKWFRYVWYAIAVLSPLVIIGFAVAGYYQSALELQIKLIYTLRLIFMIVLFHELAQRWLAITKRQLALRNARQKRKLNEQGNAAATLEGGYTLEEPLLDISKINQQSHKLLTTLVGLMLLIGFWMIWSDILPAFSVFDRIVLWQHTELVDGKASLQPITLINLLISLLYAGLTFIFVSNFPALVDLLSVGKFEISAGSRYALIQLVRYLLLSIAFLAIANELGGSWTQVQWLVAALSVGLGFGLQEIFANMVSGIIILFERPIRVGDTVTVGEVTGRVSRIQMRATHIVDYDRKELVVPNKTFITDRLINWTLSDTVTRIVIPVGVAYGSNIDEVESVLRNAIKNTPRILHDPEPNVVFSGFGDSALEFNVYVYVHELTERIEVRHGLHKNIYEALQANHIQIPFPQRDVHIHTVPTG
jgi:potassium efflux system protein